MDTPPPTPPPSVPAVPVPAAPSAPNAPSFQSVKDALAKGPAANFVDLSFGRHGAADVATIQQKVAALQAQTGAKVFVVSVPPKSDVESYRPLYDQLGMKAKDLLIVFSNDRRHLHCQAISKKAGNDILKKTKDDFYKSNVTGLGLMLDEVSHLLPKGPNSLPGAPSGSAGKPGTGKWNLGPEAVLVVVAIALLGWVFVRRRQRDAALAANLKETLAPAESAVTDAHEAVEELEKTPAVKRVIERADALDKDIEDVKRMPIGPPAVARARTLRSEARKLRREIEALAKKDDDHEKKPAKPDEAEKKPTKPDETAREEA